MLGPDLDVDRAHFAPVLLGPDAESLLLPHLEDVSPDAASSCGEADSKLRLGANLRRLLARDVECDQDTVRRTSIVDRRGRGATTPARHEGNTTRHSDDPRATGHLAADTKRPAPPPATPPQGSFRNTGPRQPPFAWRGLSRPCLRPCPAVLFVRIEGGRAHVVQLAFSGSPGSRSSCRLGDRSPDVASAEETSKRRSQRLIAPFAQGSFRNTGPAELAPTWRSPYCPERCGYRTESVAGGTLASGVMSIPRRATGRVTHWTRPSGAQVNSVRRRQPTTSVASTCAGISTCPRITTRPLAVAGVRGHSGTLAQARVARLLPGR